MKRSGPRRRRPAPAAALPTGLLVVLLVVLPGCGSPDPSPGPPEPAPSSPTAPTPTPTAPPTGSPTVTPSPTSSPEPPGKVDPSLARVVEKARADLAARLDVPQEDITVVSAELVTWPDAGLGCREKGRSYAQVLTDGSRTVLRHGGRLFAYHTGGRTAEPFWCRNPN